MPEIIGIFFFLSSLAAKMGVGDSFDLLELAPHGMFAVVMVLLLRYIPALHKEMKETIKEINQSKEKEIERIVELIDKRK